MPTRTCNKNLIVLMTDPKTEPAVAQPYCGLWLSPCHTQASDGFQRCTCPQWGHRTGIATRGRVSNLTVSVSRPVCTGFPVTGQLVRIAGTIVITRAEIRGSA